MGKLSALAVITLMSLFMFLWYQEYIQSVCVSTMLCSGYTQADEVGILHTQDTNIHHLNISGTIFQNKSIQHLDNTSKTVPDNVNTKKHVSENYIQTRIIPRSETNTSGGMLKRIRPEEDPNKIQDLFKATHRPSPVRNITVPKMTSIEIEPTAGDKHIIFIETRCLLDESQSRSDPGLSLHKRQACVIESAAKMNPDYKVYLLYSCPISGRLDDSSEYVKTIFTYPNVKLWKLNIARHFSETPLEKWDFRAAIKSSEWPNEHSSDVLRFLTLWKYGGTYLDLDVVILKYVPTYPGGLRLLN